MKSAPRRSARRRANTSEDTVRDDVVRQAARAVTEALVHLLNVTAANAPAATAPLVRSPFDARQTRRLVDAGKLDAIKVGRDWYGRPADFEALIPQKKTLATVDADPITAGADRILQEELGRRGLRLRKTAPVRELKKEGPPRELAPGPARPRALPPARKAD
ncbi:MAG: hypothetical protein L6Q76_22215 [Polyangiaceae bacterium]|nr:hypothetical protein [Polyangiaceae bacterium]